MDVQFLKDKIFEENRIVDLLSELGCHHIKQSAYMVQCANPDGDNPTAICIYLNENLTTINYTRQMLPSGQTRTTDFIDLVSFVRECTFFQSLQWICNACGYDYYEAEPEMPPSRSVLRDIMELTKADVCEPEDNTPIKPIDNGTYKTFLGTLLDEVCHALHVHIHHPRLGFAEDVEEFIDIYLALVVDISPAVVEDVCCFRRICLRVE